MSPGVGKPQLRHLPSRCSTGQGTEEGEVRRHHLLRGVGPHYVFDVRVSGIRLSAVRRQGLQPLTAVWHRPRCALPLLTPSGLQMLVLNPWDQRPQTAATVSGISRSERGVEGVVAGGE